ncbi:hypothetical protein A4X13_0g1441 [Tilletia indica]|uniref:Uncharacterized protein n=1 Tax=Tilletia indica TaxID=43049 RepID=A0A177TNU8_9BASI|nr:hypothetical protein A4X13_0g1441 [Tilletia indica]
MVDSKKTLSDPAAFKKDGANNPDVDNLEAQPPYTVYDPVGESSSAAAASRSVAQESTPFLATATAQPQQMPLVVGGIPRFSDARSETQRATARFLMAALYAFFFYILIVIIVTGRVQNFMDHGGKRHHGRHGDSDWNLDWDKEEGHWRGALIHTSPSGQNETGASKVGM